MAPLLSQMGNYFRYYRGSLRFWFQFSNLEESFTSATGIVATRKMHTIEVEARPRHLAAVMDGSIVVPTAQIDQYNLMAMGRVGPGVTAVTNWGKAALNTRTIMADSSVIGVEVPYYNQRAMSVCGSFKGLGTLSQPSDADSTVSIQPYGFTFDLFLRFIEDINDAGVHPNFTGSYMRVFVAAGDDFNFSHFITIPPIYINFTQAGAVNRLFLPALSPASFVKDTPKPHFIKSKKKRVVVEVSDSETDESIVIVGKAQAGSQTLEDENALPRRVLLSGNAESLYDRTQAGFAYKSVACKPGSLAHYICWLVLHCFEDTEQDPNVEDLISKMNQVTEYGFGFRNDIFHVGEGNTYRREQSITVGGRTFIHAEMLANLPVPTMITGGVLKDLLWRSLDWAIVEANDVLTYHERIGNWLRANADRNATKPPLTIMNELRAVIPQLRLVFDELPPEGPQNAYTWPVKCSLISPEHEYSATANSGPKHESKRAAAKLVFVALSGDLSA